MKRLLVILGLALSLLVTAPSLLAAQEGHGHGNGNGNGHGNGHGDGNGHGEGNGHGNKHQDEDQGWETRQNYQYRTYYAGQHPPGWSQGKKTGWGNCGMPPGQAKKYGCRTYVYQGRPYYYYQDEGGQIIVRRPVISVQGSVVVAP